MSLEIGSSLSSGFAIWSVSVGLRYSLKAFLGTQTKKRMSHTNDPELFANDLTVNHKDTNFLKKLAPLTIGIIGVLAGLTCFALGEENAGFSLTSFGALHLMEGIGYYQWQLHAKPKKK